MSFCREYLTDFHKCDQELVCLAQLYTICWVEQYSISADFRKVPSKTLSTPKKSKEFRHCEPMLCRCSSHISTKQQGRKWDLLLHQCPPSVWRIRIDIEKPLIDFNIQIMSSCPKFKHGLQFLETWSTKSQVQHHVLYLTWGSAERSRRRNIEKKQQLEVKAEVIFPLWFVLHMACPTLPYQRFCPHTIPHCKTKGGLNLHLK